MSMSVVLVKLTLQLHQSVLDSRGALLNDLLDLRVRVDAFDRDTDVLRGFDYRDIEALAVDEDDPLLRLFNGEPLLDGYQWTYGPPAWFDPAATQELRDALADDGDFWPQSEFVAFLDRAVAERKGIVVGVA